uniref:Ovule protein n=1 Tax=Strongyloides venezuelensis TaxID=75913 RepID=A0A0K0G5K4_STRVS
MFIFCKPKREKSKFLQGTNVTLVSKTKEILWKSSPLNLFQFPKENLTKIILRAFTLKFEALWSTPP